MGEPTKRVLHVGCGAATIDKMTDGFRDGSWREVRFDINPDVRPDIVGTIIDLAAVPGESMDAIYSSHNIEHVGAHEVTRVLREFRRVLKPSGFALITCPDAQAVAVQVAEGRLTEPLYTSPAGPITALDILYGHGAAIERGETYMAHRTAFTDRTLLDHLRAVGFASIGARRRPQRFDLWALATRSPTAPDRLRAMMRDYCRA